MPEHVKLASRIVSYRAVKTTRRWWLVGRPCVCVSIGRIVQNVIDSSLKTKYIVAVDDSNNTLEEITRVDLTSELHSRIAEKKINSPEPKIRLIFGLAMFCCDL